MICGASVAGLFKSWTVIQRHVLTKLDIVVSTKTLRRRLHEKNFRGCIIQHKPHVSKTFWKNTLWSEESKSRRFKSDGKWYVCRTENVYHNSKYTSKTSIRRCGENVMVWAACFGHGIGYIHKTNTHVDKYVYKNLLVNTMIPYVEENMPLRWRFMHGNDPKHTSRTVSSNGLISILLRTYVMM